MRIFFLKTQQLTRSFCMLLYVRGFYEHFSQYWYISYDTAMLGFCDYASSILLIIIRYLGNLPVVYR